MALLTDQFRIFTANKFIKALEGPDPIQSDTDAGADTDAAGEGAERLSTLWK